jgi:predicted acetyltransferase
MSADELELRPIESAEIPAFVQAVETAFGSVPTEDDLAFWGSLTEPDKTLAVLDGGRMVATAAWNSYELTLPAGPGSPFPVVPAPGVTAVGVHPTHRRRGLLTRMMNRQLADLRHRGHFLAILTASEAVIYGRFGYGLAQSHQEVAVATRRAAFRRPVAAGDRIRLTEPDEAGKVLPDLHDRARRLRPGDLGRLPQWWDWQFRDPEKGREGGNARFYAVHESVRGEPDGYASYRYHPAWPNGVPDSRVAVREVVALAPGVHAALWRFLLDLDLVGEVTWGMAPLDDPLRWLLADARQLRTTNVVDHVWVRLIDVPGALAARGYGSDVRLVIEVLGPDPESSGRWVLETGATGGTCRKARKADQADLSLGLADLGAVYLGGVAPSVLAAAGRVVELRPGVLARADSAFAGPVLPFCGTGF